MSKRIFSILDWIVFRLAPLVIMFAAGILTTDMYRTYDAEVIIIPSSECYTSPFVAPVPYPVPPPGGRKYYFV